MAKIPQQCAGGKGGKSQLWCDVSHREGYLWICLFVDLWICGFVYLVIGLLYITPETTNHKHKTTNYDSLLSVSRDTPRYEAISVFGTR